MTAYNFHPNMKDQRKDTTKSILGIKYVLHDTETCICSGRIQKQ